MKYVITKQEELYLIELIQVKVTAQEKINAIRMSQALGFPLSHIVRALLAQACSTWSQGAIGGFALEQEGMNSVFNALKPARKGPKA